MAYDAKVLPVMIASPSDVNDERKIVRDALAEWNVIHSQERQAVFLPVGWETHSSPELAGRPQQIINDRLLKHCDLLVGIFWTRVGSDTGKEISGSIEEILEHRNAGKPVLLYFSEVPVKPGSVNDDQWAKLLNFKEWAKTEGLFSTYESVDQFRAHFPRHLGLTLKDNEYLQSCLARSDDPADLLGAFELGLREIHISEQAEALLKAAVSGDGDVILSEYIGGASIQAGSEIFPANTRKELAKWKSGIQDLRNAGLIEDRGYKGEIFEVTHAGYEYAERQGWPVSDAEPD
ncbi:hypothetical protein ACO2RV_24775 [Ancylobacter sp. VNQ12]|uniref:hypothetical protein n=1 Tax=Ancylobacter sp. VNQ12 TaxID=3400920 RepID=UPI003BFF5562